MALTIPIPISELLQEKDLAGKPLVDYEIAGEIDQIPLSLPSQSPEEQSGGWAELAAFQFAPSRSEQASPWNNERRLFVRLPEAVSYLTRALSLALSIDDDRRASLAVAAMLSFFESEASQITMAHGHLSSTTFCKTRRHRSCRNRKGGSPQASKACYKELPL